MDYWFSKRVQNGLAIILESIKYIENTEIKNFFLISFSKIIKKVSYADSRIAVPVKLNPQKSNISPNVLERVKKHLVFLDNVDVFNYFKNVCIENIKRISSLAPYKNLINTEIIGNNALNLKVNNVNAVDDSCIDLIITSPPYLGAQKYIRSVALNIGWIEMAKTKDINQLNKNIIGREFYKKSEYQNLLLTGISNADKLIKSIGTKNSLRAHICIQYLLDMQVVIKEMTRVLKPKGFLILISANNTVCGKTFMTSEYLEEICLKNNMKLRLVLRDDIRSRGLMTKRNKTADIISCEMVHIWEKN